MTVFKYFKFLLVALAAYFIIIFTGCMANKHHTKYYNKPLHEVKNAIERSMGNLKMKKLPQKQQNVLEYKVPGIVGKISFKIEEKEDITKVRIKEPSWQTKYRESPYISAFQQELFEYKKSTENIKSKSYRKGTILSLCSAAFAYPYILNDHQLIYDEEFRDYDLFLPVMLFFADTYLPLDNISKGIKVEGSIAMFLGFRILMLYATKASIKQYNTLMGAGYDYNVDFSNGYLSFKKRQSVQPKRQKIHVKRKHKKPKTHVKKKDVDIEELEKRKLITVAPLGLLNKSLFINYERRMGDKGSMRLNLGFYNISNGLYSARGGGYWYTDCFNIGFTYFMVPRKKLTGLCVGPRVDIYIINYEYIDYDSNWVRILEETGTKVYYGIGLETIVRIQVEDTDLIIEFGGVGLYRIGNDLESSTGALPPEIPDASEYRAIFNIGHPF